MNTRLFLVILTLGFSGVFSASGTAADGIAFDQRPNWLHQQSWIHNSQGNIRADLEQAEREGKSLMILWEQPGCLYCDRLHDQNFAKPRIRKMLEKNFLVVQLNRAGKRKIRAPSGKIMTEAKLAKELRVNGTPTTVVFNSGGVLEDVGRRAEAFRMPGYLTPFHYFTVIGYFLSDQHDDLSLSEFSDLTARDFRDSGINPNRW